MRGAGSPSSLTTYPEVRCCAGAARRAGYDAHRLQTSYPQLPVFQAGGAAAYGRAAPVVEVQRMAQRLMKNGLRVNGRLSLKILVQRVISRCIRALRCGHAGEAARPATRRDDCYSGATGG